MIKKLEKYFSNQLLRLHFRQNVFSRRKLKGKYNLWTDANAPPLAKKFYVTPSIAKNGNWKWIERTGHITNFAWIRSRKGQNLSRLFRVRWNINNPIPVLLRFIKVHTWFWKSIILYTEAARPFDRQYGPSLKIWIENYSVVA